MKQGRGFQDRKGTDGMYRGYKIDTRQTRQMWANEIETRNVEKKEQAIQRGDTWDREGKDRTVIDWTEINHMEKSKQN